MKRHSTDSRGSVWKEYEREVKKIFGWIKATNWKPDVPRGSQAPKGGR